VQQHRVTKGETHLLDVTDYFSQHLGKTLLIITLAILRSCPFCSNVGRVVQRVGDIIRSTSPALRFHARLPSAPITDPVIHFREAGSLQRRFAIPTMLPTAVETAAESTKTSTHVLLASFD
jgi:hypothetical protein